MVKHLLYISDETRNKIWHPVDFLIHENAFIGKVHLDSTFFLGINCTSPKLPPDIRSNDREVLYSGAENDLIMVQKFRVTYPCNMDMMYFPFDKQACQFDLKMKTKSNHSVILKADPDISLIVSYAGPNILHEYKVVNIK